ncbi:hypothetical protein SAMN05444395_103308 [Flavobacterium fryxellicola]|uniref:YtkA-like domain-containing protein n=1 Tax=Flavobacterium fryxellicola TaxID=249352 RepID=A0A167WZT6_9FLAO|nr:hypothetical protein [Flavobacterium fryxellicola]OAB27893.1 hypothetical protein FBFR_08485 [Flavobacterium fryxellicola]SHN65922.1 hypothetical protein SAMN05444395_103308 [Flavobacterium fryxellicola]
MKFQLKNILAVMAISIVLFSCSSDSDTPVVDELAELTKFKEIANSTHTIELYAHRGALEQGYNEISLRIKDKASGEYIKNATITWIPLMHMTMMTHSCPKSGVGKITADGTLYQGTIVFQMPQNATEYWDLKIDYTINGTAYTVTSIIDVPASAKQRVTTFTGSDNVKYIVAYVEPQLPKVALNDMTVGVYKMESMMSFPVVNNFKVKIDPRMPSMGNHGSPNNVDLTQSISDKLYHGKLALTMTGLWKINLQLVNASDVVLKGESITDVVPASSIYFEIEF